VFRHPEAFTAQQRAEVSHVSGRSWAKVVVFFADDEPILAVIPAHVLVDTEQLRVLAGAGRLRLAAEHEFASLYPDCEPGATAPFAGSLRRVFVEQSLVGEPEMVFNAGTHTDAIRMHYADFTTVTHPVVGTFARPPR
jgi:Ala-tRNA(Pro) deacylase